MTKMTAPFVVDGPMTRAAFLAYLEQCLGPTLKRGDMVIIDNLPAHRGVRRESPSKLPLPSCFTCQNIRSDERPLKKLKLITAKQPVEPFHVFAARIALT